MGWDDIEKVVSESSGNGGIFLKLKEDKDKAVVAFCGEPYAQEVVWIGGVSYPYDPKTHIGERTRLVIKCNVFNVSTGSMQIWQFGAAVFRTIKTLRDKYGLDKWTFEITRNGAAGDKQTTYSILPEEKISDELAFKIANAELHDLAGAVFRGDPLPGSGEYISEAVAKEIYAELKNLPRPQVDEFLAAFAVKKITDLPAKAEKAARAMLKSMASDEPVEDQLPF